MKKDLITEDKVTNKKDIDIANLCKKHKSNPIWIGDFNLPDIEWETCSIVGSQNPKILNVQFLELIDNHKLSQVVEFPSRKEATLDLLVTNRKKFRGKKIYPGFGDHQSAILSDVYCHPKRQKPIQLKVYNWRRANIN